MDTQMNTTVQATTQSVQATIKLLSDKQREALLGIAEGNDPADFHHKTMGSLREQGFIREDEDVITLTPEGEEVAIALTRETQKVRPSGLVPRKETPPPPPPRPQGGEAAAAQTKVHPWSYEGQNPGAAKRDPTPSPSPEAKRDPTLGPSPEAERGEKKGIEGVADAVNNRDWMLGKESAAEANGHDCEGCSYRQAVELMAKRFPELGELVEVLQKAERWLGTG